MSRLLDIREKLRDTTAAVAQVERAVAQGPQSASIDLMAASVLKRQRQLENEFKAAAEQVGVELCSYRMFSDDDQPKAAGVASALLDFQALFTVVFDALKNGPKETTKVAPEISAVSAFNFAYTFAGSVGVVLTVPAERNLFGGTDFDNAIDTIFEMARAESSEQILAFARRLGSSPVRVLNQWVVDHAKYGMGVEIEWRPGSDTRRNLLMQRPQMLKLSEAIAQTSDETVTPFSIDGDLVGVDVPLKKFHIREDNGTDIRGTFTAAINTSHTVELPKRYRASLTATRKTRFSTDEESVTYVLEQLQPF